MSTREEIAIALANIGRSADGKRLIERLKSKLNEVAPIGAEPGALSDLNGERRLARELIEQLTRDLDDRAEPASTAAEPEPDRPVAGGRSRGARRPVPAS